MDNLTLMLLLDAVVLAACVIALLKFGRITAMHPATTYLFFHVYVVTLRLLALANGANTIASLRGAVTLDEIVRAGVVADLALLAMTVAWILLARRDLRQYGPLPASDSDLPRNLDKRFFWSIAPIASTIGLVVLINFGDAATSINSGDWRSSSYVGITVTWPYQALLILIYYYGFKKWLFIPAVVLLGFMITNTSRFVLIVSVVFMCFVYLSRRQKRWFPIWMMIIVVIVGIIFFPLKQIASGIRVGDRVETIANDAFDYSQEALATSSGDTVFLDQAASVMTLVDLHGDFFYGTPWLQLLIAPIPRFWWPDKPRMNEYLWELSTDDRPMGEMGMVPTLAGDAYVNFGYLGAIVIPFMVAYAYGWGYFRAFRQSHYSVARFIYLVFACNLIQVFRDGVISIFTFTLIASMPMMFVIYLHWLQRPFRSRVIAAHRPISFSSPSATTSRNDRSLP